MANEYRFGDIEAKTFHRLLQEYPSFVTEKVRTLDTDRYVEIPAALSKRTAHGTKAYLTLEELSVLVDWKLAHGTFRPSLKKLVASNSDTDVRNVTEAGFAECSSSRDHKASLTKLAELKGVGPATASLLLSAYDAANHPFFSDELYRWSHWRDGAKAGWDRPIKYTHKEYSELHQRVKELRARLEAECGMSVPAVDIEKVAYVLGKQGADLRLPAAEQATLETKDEQHSRGPQARSVGKKRAAPTVAKQHDTAAQEELNSTQSKSLRYSKRLRSK